ncbi:PspC domain-containing protein [Streptosporangium sp. DT93]|uniref:PspC domain-containing protein n=1 Tax=Streptosporangium sp. DT93 TaxID=3393428 RepID=UPI003CE673AF
MNDTGRAQDQTSGVPGPEPALPERDRGLGRSDQGRMLTGVCAGLGRYAGVDPVLFRVGFAVLLLGSGIGVILYIAAFLLMRETDGGPGHLEQWTRRDFDGETVLTLLTGVFVLGLVINVSSDGVGTGTIVVGTVLAIALMAAHARGVDLLAVARSLPDRLRRRREPHPADPWQPPAASPMPPVAATSPFPPGPSGQPGQPGPVPAASPVPPTTQSPWASQGPSASHAPPASQVPSASSASQASWTETGGRSRPFAEDDHVTRATSATGYAPGNVPGDTTEDPAGHAGHAGHTAGYETGNTAVNAAHAAGPEGGTESGTATEPSAPNPPDEYAPRPDAYGPGPDRPYGDVPPSPYRVAVPSFDSSGEPFSPYGPYRPLDPRRREGLHSPYAPSGYGGAVEAPPRTARPRSFVGAVTIILAMIVGGVTVAIQSTSGSVDMTIAGGAALAVIGTGLLVATWFGRGAGLVVIGTVLSLALVAGSLLAGMPKKFGDYHWEPATLSEVAGGYEVGVGEGVLDLSELTLPPGSRTVLDASVTVGEISVVLPATARVEVNGSTRFGDVKIDHTVEGGADIRYSKVLEPEVTPRGDVATIVLNVKAGIGDVEVRRAA